MAGRVEDLLEEAGIEGTQDQVLDDNGFEAFELGVGGQQRAIDAADAGTMNGDAVELGRLVPGLGVVAFLLGGEIALGRARGVGLAVGKELGFGLFALEATDLVAEALVLVAEGAVLGDEVLDEVEETNDGLTRRVVGESPEIEVEIEGVQGNHSQNG